MMELCLDITDTILWYFHYLLIEANVLQIPSYTINSLKSIYRSQVNLRSSCSRRSLYPNLQRLIHFFEPLLDDRSINKTKDREKTAEIFRLNNFAINRLAILPNF